LEFDSCEKLLVARRTGLREVVWTAQQDPLSLHAPEFLGLDSCILRIFGKLGHCLCWF
jgi:hypothetical protein